MAFILISLSLSLSQKGVTLNPKNNVQFIGNPPTMINTQTGRPTTTITQTTTSNTRPENSPTNLMNQVGGGGGGGLLNAQVNLPFSLGGFGINLSNGFSPNQKPSASMMMNPINHPSVLQTTVESIETVQLNRSKDEQINRELVDHRAVEDEEEKPVEVGEGGADEESERG
ncbi:hypothetical protein DFH28DRAFT_930649 [Melampsora americana]|nr:hypothetical protein DFH28DRAFT_930649 [Melampsora americana]